MILPGEIERLRDLRSSDTDAHIDLSRARSCIVTKAAYGSYTTGGPFDLMRYLFSDGQGSSGLVRGDIIRGELFGVYTNFLAGGTANLGMQLVCGPSPIAEFTQSVADQAAIYSAWRLAFVIRLSGTPDTLNTPVGKAVATPYAYVSLTMGDTATSIYSTSQIEAYTNVTGTDPSSARDIPLTRPVGVSVRYTPEPDTELIVYGGVIEGL